MAPGITDKQKDNKITGAGYSAGWKIGPPAAQLTLPTKERIEMDQLQLTRYDAPFPRDDRLHYT
jgi:hypothetical protein